MTIRAITIGTYAIAIAAFAAAPLQFGPDGLRSAIAHAAHGTPDGNNGHGDLNGTDSKVDDASNPNYDPERENPDDGNSGIGDDKNGNNGKRPKG